MTLLLAAALAFAADADVRALGGPCAPVPRLREWSERVSRQLAAERRKAVRESYLLAREVVRGDCTSHHWWFRLAEAAWAAGEPAVAVAAIEALYQRRESTIEQRLEQPPLNELVKTAQFRGSPVAARLARDRQSRLERRERALALAASAPAPPDPYVARPACPFECCMLGRWTAREAVDVYERVDGPLAFRLKAGSAVTAVTGEVHLKPRPVLVRYGSPEGFQAKVGSVVYLLDYGGEGRGNVWVEGRVRLGRHDLIGVACPSPGEECWGEELNPGTPPAVWWVEIRYRGQRGWLKNPARAFKGSDQCG